MKLFLQIAFLLSICIGANAQAGAPKSFYGVWELVAVKSISADSVVAYPYGENPVGNMILTETGDYSIEIYRSGRSKIASGNKTTATPEENTMMVQGSNAHYGKFSIDKANAVVTFNVEHAFFPNWEGVSLKQQYVLNGNLVTFSSKTSTFGASTAVVVWRKK